MQKGEDSDQPQRYGKERSQIAKTSNSKLIGDVRVFLYTLLQTFWDGLYWAIVSFLRSNKTLNIMCLNFDLLFPLKNQLFPLIRKECMRNELYSLTKIYSSSNRKLWNSIQDKIQKADSFHMGNPKVHKTQNTLQEFRWISTDYFEDPTIPFLLKPQQIIDGRNLHSSMLYQRKSHLDQASMREINLTSFATSPKEQQTG